MNSNYKKTPMKNKRPANKPAGKSPTKKKK
jgi:hypothetical protein